MVVFTHQPFSTVGLFLICRVIGAEMAASTKRQVFGEFVMPFNLGRSFLDRAKQGFVPDPL